MGNPNCFIFIPIEKNLVNRKNEIIFNNFKIQLQKQWFDDTLLTSIVIMRGMECSADEKYAEVFYNRKIIH